MMISQPTAENIEAAIEDIRKKKPAFANIAKAFRELLIRRALLKAEMALPDQVFKPDPVRFSQGVSVWLQDSLIFSEDYPRKAIDRLFPAMGKGFPRIAPDLNILKTAITKKRFAPETIIEAILKGQEDLVTETASRLGMAPGLLQFVSLQVMKPFLEKLSEAMAPRIAHLDWHRGNCPICGAYPELSFLSTDAGQRWLRCSVCAHSWRYIRTRCPACENDDQSRMETLFIEDLPQERAELCHRCKHYIVSLDLRKCPQPVVFETATLTMIHLDVISQNKGYVPMATSAWNMMN
ncbi:MAG: formate dehydrogenase accessory protein FdhE [Deltaproteobacteria bacterium]|nr:formate dehydrogenase accessory protein FdhE [Deltaproteobacteria bacterium]